MGSGSWDSDFKCSEKGGGVHQICFKKLGEKSNNFSKATGQSDWSNERKNNNHCVCLGAWALYVAKRNKGEFKDNSQNQLKCNAIPKISLSSNYIDKFTGWDKWNGMEYSDQVKDGVEELVKQCYSQGSSVQKKNLLKNYCSFARKTQSLKNSDLYKSYC